jgi:RNA polymerase sigma-70 factor (ECF subfamily)
MQGGAQAAASAAVRILDSVPDYGLESTASLLAKVRGGDEAARERLMARYLPIFKRWAHGRLPNRARDSDDTDDLVQDTLVAAMKRLHEFEPRREGAFLAYLRKILLNQIRDHIRGADRRPLPESLPEDLPDGARDPLQSLISKQILETYEAALARLTELQREAFLLRMELRFSHAEIAEAIGVRSPDAARKHVVRAMVRLAEILRSNGGVTELG